MNARVSFRCPGWSVDVHASDMPIALPRKGDEVWIGNKLHVCKNVTWNLGVGNLDRGMGDLVEVVCVITLVEA